MRPKGKSESWQRQLAGSDSSLLDSVLSAQERADAEHEAREAVRKAGAPKEPLSPLAAEALSLGKVSIHRDIEDHHMSIALERNYGTLADVLDRALEQASGGKGNERHAQGQPFEEQPMQTISRLLSSTEGMRFQAIKKIQESARMDQQDRRTAELLGAINYIAGIIIYEER